MKELAVIGCIVLAIVATINILANVSLQKEVNQLEIDNKLLIERRYRIECGQIPRPAQTTD